MNKIIALLLCLVIILSFAGCGKEKPADTPSTRVMQGTVTEIQSGTMLVTPAEDSWESLSSDRFGIPIGNMPSSPEPEVGDTVEVLYDGNICETYPATLGLIISVRVTEKGQAQSVLKNAPELTVMTDSQSVTAGQGTTSWMYRVEGDRWSGVEMDALHPLDIDTGEEARVLRLDNATAQGSMKPVEARLLLDPAPDYVKVRCWDETHWGKPEDDAQAETVPCDDLCMELKNGSYIYEVTAVWSSAPDYNGTARYYFCAISSAAEGDTTDDDYAGPYIPSESDGLPTIVE